MANLLFRLNQGVGRLLAGSGLVWLILVVLVGLAVFRFVLPPETYLPLASADFRLVEPDLEGIVLISDGGVYLLLRGSQLWWQRGEQATLVADNFINLLQEQDVLWIKTDTTIGALDIQTGAVAAKDVYIDRDFAPSHLVGVDSRGYHLYRHGRIKVADDSGIVSGPHSLSGNIRPAWLERDWGKEILFYHTNGWIIYRNYRAAASYNFLHAKILVEAEASPDLKFVLYVLEDGQETQLWSARADGSQRALIHTLEASFSSLESVWSPTGHQVALTLLGCSKTSLTGEVYAGTTLLFEPVTGYAIVLDEFNSPHITLPIPSAWDRDGRTIYFYHADTEDKRPIAYHLVRR